MSKHANPTIWPTVDAARPAHSAGWTFRTQSMDRMSHVMGAPYTPGKHAKPFAAHHPATPVTYDATGRTTPLNPPTLALDVAA